MKTFALLCDDEKNRETMQLRNIPMFYLFNEVVAGPLFQVLFVHPCKFP